MEAFADHSAELCVFIGCEMPTIEASVGVDHHLTLTGHLLNAPSTTVSLLDTQSQELQLCGYRSDFRHLQREPVAAAKRHLRFRFRPVGLLARRFHRRVEPVLAFQLDSDFNGYCGIQLRRVDQECIVTRMADWNGTVNVTYDYTEGSDGGSHAVPEPGALSLFAAGLFGIGLVRRRKSA